jgi:isopenicillin N synthase-like dioxygenase
MTAAHWIPSIDLAGARTGDVAARRAIAGEIDAACSTSGFLTVRGHGIDPSLQTTIREETMSFFAASDTEKEACAVRDGDPARRGFHRMGRVAASIGIDTPPDLCESFSINRLGEAAAASAVTTEDERLVWPNIWPANRGALRAAWLAWFDAMNELAAELMRLFALALGLDEAWFDRYIDHNASNLGANFYPAQERPPGPGQLRKGAHTDWGSLTILMQDPTAASTASGLQVQHPDGTWLDVPPTEGELVVNIGDLMAIWTNGRWVSTMHRVVNPGTGDRSPRLSLAFFHQPNDDAVIATIPTCGTPSGKPVTSGEWFRRKLQLAFGTGS